MKKKLVFILLFLLFSCSNEQDYLICNSSNSEHCKFFEIKYPNYIKEFQKLNIDSEGNELAVKDLNTYLDINNIFLDKANSESIFHSIVPRAILLIIEAISGIGIRKDGWETSGIPSGE